MSSLSPVSARTFDQIFGFTSWRGISAMAWTKRQANTQTDMVDSKKNRPREPIQWKSKSCLHFKRGLCQQCLAPQGFTMYSGLLLGQGDVLTMLSSAVIYHLQWPTDELGKHVVHGKLPRSADLPRYTVYSDYCWAREACTDCMATHNFTEHCHEH